MDTRNYNEPDNCGLEDCDCSEVNKCGCTYPNNISAYTCKEGVCQPFSEEKTNFQGEAMVDNHPASKKNTSKTHVAEGTVCVCSPQACDCSSGKDK